MKSFLAAFVFALLCLPVCAAGAIQVDDFTVCPAVDANLPPSVRFDGPDCQHAVTGGLDPQGRDLWVKARVTVPKAMLGEGPLGLYISAKASSEVYLNGVRIGANGRPGASKALETPGRMDAVFYIPEGRLQAGGNDIVLRLSSFHNVVRLSRPVHWIAIGPYDDPVDLLLRAYWPSLVTFGVLLAGAFFFASTAISGVNRRDPLLLALMSFLAAAQLFAEVYRGLSPYAYPTQDWRLIVIALLATAFALTMAALIAFRFATRPWMASGLAAVATLLPVFVMAGYDGKAAFALFAAALASLVMVGRTAIKGDRLAMVACLALGGLAASVVVFQDRFLDTVFFYEVAGFLLVLFTLRALMFERERRDHEAERMRAHDLEVALASALQAKKPVAIHVKSAGSVDIVNSMDITLCKGADDYVELHLIDGRTLLHNGALSDLEAELPASFLRVHRSYIVNSAFIEKLIRENSGVGCLKLSNGAQAPVSRRIMPKVRDALR